MLQFIVLKVPTPTSVCHQSHKMVPNHGDNADSLTFVRSEQQENGDMVLHQKLHSNNTKKNQLSPSNPYHSFLDREKDVERETRER